MIDVREYDPEWPRRFERLRTEYEESMRDAGVPVVSIEHVGSTAVPGLAGKPVVDVDIVVTPEHVSMATAVLVDKGFEPRGEVGIPQRWAFWEPERLLGTNTYVVESGSLALRNHVTFRDTLRSDAALRSEYATIKRIVAATAIDIYEYGSGKNDVIQRILAAGGLSVEELAALGANNVPMTEREQ